MKPRITKAAILLLIVAIFSSSSVPVLAVVKAPVKPSVTKAKVTIKKTTSTKVVTKKKLTKKKKTKKKRKEKLNLNPPLIDPLHPPGGR